VYICLIADFISSFNIGFFDHKPRGCPQNVARKLAYTRLRFAVCPRIVRCYSIVLKLGTIAVQHVLQLAGILSDEGLRQMARSLGNDWRRLASALRLPSSSSGGATSTYEVLRDWRDRCSGDVRVRLYDALMSAKRGDLAQKLIDEKTTSNLDKLVTVV